MCTAKRLWPDNAPSIPDSAKVWIHCHEVDHKTSPFYVGFGIIASATEERVRHVAHIFGHRVQWSSTRRK